MILLRRKAEKLILSLTFKNCPEYCLLKVKQKQRKGKPKNWKIRIYTVTLLEEKNGDSIGLTKIIAV
jgi:cytochrome oxidase Cu insertion factor (SCO1/SenC/PrrC family)